MRQGKLAQSAAFVRSQSSRESDQKFDFATSLSSVCQSRAAYLYRKILATRHASGERKTIPFGRSCQRKCVIVDRSKTDCAPGLCFETAI